MKKMFFLLIVGLLMAPLGVDAVSVSPLRFDNLDMQPGTSQMVTVSIKRLVEESNILFPVVKGFSSRDESGSPALTNEDAAVLNWIKPVTEEIVFEGNQVDYDLDVVIDVPLDADPGGHYAALFVSTEPATEFETSSVGIGSKLGVLFLINVAGDVIENAELLEFGVDKDLSAGNRLPVTLFARVQNEGTVHYRPSGRIEIKNMFGGDATTLVFNESGGNVLPGSIRRFDTEWSKDSEATGTGFFGEVQNEWQHFAIGRYTAELTMDWTDTGALLKAQTAFWVIPWRLMFLGLIGLIILFGLIKGYNKAVVAVAKKAKK